MTRPPWYVGLTGAAEGDGEFDGGDGEEEGVNPRDGDTEGEMEDPLTQLLALLDQSCAPESTRGQ